MDFINIFFDTNIVKKIDSNLIKFELNETYIRFRDFAFNNGYDFIKIFIPKIVIEELKKQYIEEYKEETAKIKEKLEQIYKPLDKLQWNINISKKLDISFRDYMAFIEKDIDEYLKKENINLCPYPKNEILPDIITRAIHRKAPFYEGKYNQKHFSDAGFKDVIFLESVYEKIKNNNQKNYIVTKDKFFYDNELKNEIKNYNVEIINYDTGLKLIEYFCNKYKLNDFSEIRKFTKQNYFIESIENNIDYKVLNKTFNIIKHKEEESLDELYYIYVEVIDINNIKKEIIVKLTENNDFVEIIDSKTEEVLYVWED